MRKRRFILISIIGFLSLFSACRKGSEDPWLSLNSRTTRVAGDWNIVNYNKTETTIYAYPSGKILTNTYAQEFGLVNYSETTSDTGNTLIVRGGKIGQSSFHFDKSGNWSSVIDYYLYSPLAVGGFYVSRTRMEEDGLWEFQGKNDGLGNKESMKLTTANLHQFFYTYSTYLGTVVDSVADSTSVSYAAGEKYQIWKLIGLSNTRIKAEIFSESSYNSAVSGIAGTKISTTDEISIELNQ